MKKDTIIRASLNEGNYATIRRECLFDPRLSETGLRLLIILLNNSKDWEISTTYYQRKLGWSPGKMSSAKKNLKELGYLKELKEGSGKGTDYSYTVNEKVFISEVEAKQYLKSKSQKLKSNNRKSETEVQTLDINNIKRDNIKEEKKKEKEIKKEECSVSVNSNNVNSKANKLEGIKNDTQHDTTPKLKKEDFFFDYGERPSDEKVIAYVHGKRGYSIQVGQEIYSQLLTRDFKNKEGEPINGMQKYIDAKLMDYGAPGENSNGISSIDEFLALSNNLHRFYVDKSMECNQDKPLDRQSGLFHMKDAAKSYFKTISNNHSSYMHYVKDYIEENGYRPASSFKAYVQKHRERQLSKSGTDYLKRSF